MDKENVSHTHIEEYYLVTKKEENPSTCDNMDGPQGHCVKWKESGREKQILYNLIHGIIKQKEPPQMWTYKVPRKQCVCVHAKSLQLVWLFVSLWTVAHQAPPTKIL